MSQKKKTRKTITTPASPSIQKKINRIACHHVRNAG